MKGCSDFGRDCPSCQPKKGRLVDHSLLWLLARGVVFQRWAIFGTFNAPRAIPGREAHFQIAFGHPFSGFRSYRLLLPFLRNRFRLSGQLVKFGLGQFQVTEPPIAIAPAAAARTPGRPVLVAFLIEARNAHKPVRLLDNLFRVMEDSKQFDAAEFL